MCKCCLQKICLEPTENIWLTSFYERISHLLFTSSFYVSHKRAFILEQVKIKAFWNLNFTWWNRWNERRNFFMTSYTFFILYHPHCIRLLQIFWFIFHSKKNYDKISINFIFHTTTIKSAKFNTWKITLEVEKKIIDNNKLP